VNDAVPKVTVIILTYNHERFIEQAIESVLSQETDFSYDIVILEDCSTDRTRDIVVAYQQAHPARIRLVLAETNRCDNAGLRNAIQASVSPFVALLDGDDYWTSKVKLQRQIEYLEQHPECALCFHNVDLVFDDGAQERHPARPADQKEVSTLDDLLESCFITTCSAVLRRRGLVDLPAWYVDDPSADWSLFVLAAQHGHLGYLNEVMAVYRQHAGGFWTGRGRIAQMERVIRFYELLTGRLPARYTGRIRTLLARQCHELALEYRQAGHHDSVQRLLRQCVAAEPDPRKILWWLRVAGDGAADLEFPPSQPDAVRVTIGKAPPAIFDIQLNQPHLAVRSGFRYALGFRARADRARGLYVGFAQAHEPWAGLGLHTRVALGPEWQYFEESFIAPADDDNGRIHFDAGDNPVSFEIASVTLRTLPEGVMMEPGLLSLRTS
jgi:hypothetical protein